jgi:LysR family transcriptional regulator, low CO2-responsive transcriptional regulator
LPSLRSLSLNLDRLRTFRKVVELESFSRAAEELFLSQPAVSLQIRHLERELGVVLIDRHAARAVATPAGTALLAFAEHVDQGNAQLQRQLAALQNEHAFVSIGCSATSAKQFVPRIISAVSQLAPEVHVRVITLPPDEAVAKVLRGELDFVLTTEGFISNRLEAEQILTARLFIVGQPTNPLARRERVTPEEVARYPFALLPAPWSAQARFREWASNQGVEIRVAMELSSYDGLKEAARNGLALAVVAETAIIGDIQRGDLAMIRTVGLPIEYPIFLAHRAGPLTSHARAVRTAAIRMAAMNRPMLDIA